MTQLDLFAPPPSRVIFPDRMCKDCAFADFTVNGLYTYPLLQCHMPSYLIFSPGYGLGDKCRATWWPDDSKSAWCNDTIRESMEHPPARILAEFDRQALDGRLD